MSLIPLQPFIDKWKNKPCEAGGSAGAKNQCVDLINQFLDESALPKVLGANAADFPSRIGSDWEWVANTANNFPSERNFLIWGSPYGKYVENGVTKYAGHISLATKNCSPTKLESFDQNWNPGQLCTIINHGYAGLKGWLRYKGGSSMADMYTMKSGNKVDLGNRDSNVVLADKFDEVLYQKLYVKTTDKDAEVKVVQDDLDKERRVSSTLVTNIISINRLLGLSENATNDQTLAEIQRLKDNQGVGTTNEPPTTIKLSTGRVASLNGLLWIEGKLQGNYKLD